MMMLALSGAGSRIDFSIESMQSQRFGVGVFCLLMLGIVLFAGIIIAVMRGTGGQKVTRTGERLMFGAIIAGVLVAMVFASLQMLSGVLF
ncbi:MAG: hypothetical protein ACHP9S_11230 [Terriglobales bacterium]